MNRLFEEVIKNEISQESTASQESFIDRLFPSKEIKRKKRRQESEILSPIVEQIVERYGEKQTKIEMDDGVNPSTPMKIVIYGQQKDNPLFVELIAVRNQDSVIVKKQQGKQYVICEQETAEGIYYSYGKAFGDNVKFDDYELAPGISLEKDLGWDFLIIVSYRDNNDPSQPQQSASALAVSCNEKTSWKDIESVFDTIDKDAEKKFENRKYRSIVFY